MNLDFFHIYSSCDDDTTLLHAKSSPARCFSLHNFPRIIFGLVLCFFFLHVFYDTRKAKGILITDNTFVTKSKLPVNAFKHWRQKVNETKLVIKFLRQQEQQLKNSK